MNDWTLVDNALVSGTWRGVMTFTDVPVRQTHEGNWWLIDDDGKLAKFIADEKGKLAGDTTITGVKPPAPENPWLAFAQDAHWQHTWSRENYGEGSVIYTTEELRIGWDRVMKDSPEYTIGIPLPAEYTPVELVQKWVPINV